MLPIRLWLGLHLSYHTYLEDFLWQEILLNNYKSNYTLIYYETEWHSVLV